MTDKKNSELLSEARDGYKEGLQADDHNRKNYRDDVRFAKLGEQWHSEDKKKRESDNRPCLTINKMPAFIRQVVNDARQNKPRITVSPNDSAADPKTAEVIAGVIRNIENASTSKLAYNSAIDSSVSGGFGYFRIDITDAYNDVYDDDIVIEPIYDALTVVGDPDHQEADSRNWNVAFVTETLSERQFKKKYKGKSKVSWNGDVWDSVDSSWKSEESITVCEYWWREEVEKPGCVIENVKGERSLITKEQFESAEIQTLIETGAFKKIKEKAIKSYVVKQVVMNGVELLSDVKTWPGQYIPIVPVYGDSFTLEGKRYLLSLIHYAKDPQRNFNYWRTSATELVALAPRSPWLGPEGTFVGKNWSKANTENVPYLEYDPELGPPSRQPLDTGAAAGALSEAANANDDIKSATGMYDASLGARSNETSGRAIIARQREGDTNTFHFIDNLTIAIEHAGRILVDLIPHVYSDERIVRILGEDDEMKLVKLNAPYPSIGEDGKIETDENGNPIMIMHDVRTGKYDVIAKAGPGYTTRREEAANQMMELLRAFPQAAPYIADILANNLDWPDADKVKARLKKLIPGGEEEQIPPEMQQMLQKLQATVEQLSSKNAELELKMDDKRQSNLIDLFEARTKRIEIALKNGISPQSLFSPEELNGQ